jgi:lipopolysaccharide transport system permease protein
MSSDPPPTESVGAPVITVDIDVARGIFRGRVLGLRGLWSYRELLAVLVWRDVKARYRQTSVGLAWAVFQPALMTAAFTLFFQPPAAGDAPAVPYAVYVYSGFVAWTFFSTAVLAAGNSVLASEVMISRSYFPRLFLPWAAVGSVVIDLTVACAGLVVLMGCYGMAPPPQCLLVPALVLLIALAAAGAGTLFAALNVRYRDFRYLVPFLMQLWMFSTPALFVQAAGSPAGDGSPPGGDLTLRSLLLALNPMNGLVASFRAAALGGPLPWQQLGPAALATLLLVLAGGWYYRRVEHSFADVI